jgi:hypothetical protein
LTLFPLHFGQETLVISCSEMLRIIAAFALILVCGHFNPPLSGNALIGFSRLSYLNELEYIVKEGNIHCRRIRLTGKRLPAILVSSILVYKNGGVATVGLTPR